MIKSTLFDLQNLKSLAPAPVILSRYRRGSFPQNFRENEKVRVVFPSYSNERQRPTVKRSKPFFDL